MRKQNKNAGDENIKKFVNNDTFEASYQKKINNGSNMVQFAREYCNHL